MISRRQTLGLFGAAAATALSAGHQARACSCNGIPHRLAEERGAGALAKRRGALGKAARRQGHHRQLVGIHLRSAAAGGARRRCARFRRDGRRAAAFRAGGRRSPLLCRHSIGAAPAGSAILVRKDSADPDAGRPEGQEGRLQARFERPQCNGEGFAQGWPGAGRYRGHRSRRRRTPPLPSRTAASMLGRSGIPIWPIARGRSRNADSDDGAKALSTPTASFLRMPSSPMRTDRSSSTCLTSCAGRPVRTEQSRATVKELSEITGVPPEVTRVTLTRAGADLGSVSRNYATPLRPTSRRWPMSSTSSASCRSS